MVRQVTDSLYWIHECTEAPDADHHVHSSLYIIEHEGNHILLDDGPFLHAEGLKEQVEDITGPSGPDANFVFKPHTPHSGNAGHFKETWEDMEVVFPIGGAKVSGIPTPVTGFDELLGPISIEGRPMSLTEVPIIDVQTTTWVFDEVDNVWFTLEGFGYFHEGDQCNLLSEEYGEGIRYGHISDYYADDFVAWAKYVDAERCVSRLMDLLDEYEPEIIAPAHGAPIMGDDIDHYMRQFAEAMEVKEEGFELPPYGNYQTEV